MRRLLHSTKVISTTILCVRRSRNLVLIGDGQVTFHNTCLKATANKVRSLANGSVLAGFAGSVGDAITLLERLESQLEAHNGQLLKAAVELAKLWRTEKYMRNLEAVVLAADKDVTLQVSGQGDVISADGEDHVMAIGSGSLPALAAAEALMKETDLPAKAIARRAMDIASDLCVYTNKNFVELNLSKS